MRTPQKFDPSRLPAPFARFVLLVAASKGGVGKSTIAIHLAIVAHLEGIRTIILDADTEDEQQSCAVWAQSRTRTGPTGPKVIKVAPTRIVEALDWAEREDYAFIIIDTPGRDVVATRTALERADFMLTPSQASPLDLQATRPIRRLWDISKTPAAIVLNGVIRETLPRTRAYIDRYSEQGTVLPAVLGRRVQYIDAIEKGLGVSEYKPGDIGDREMRRLLDTILSEAAHRRTVG